MPKNDTHNSAFINHLGLVRGKFQGEGNLLITAYSLNQTLFSECPDVILEEAPAGYIETLANFQGQMIQVEFAVDEIDEWFNSCEVIPFIRPVAGSLPRG